MRWIPITERLPEGEDAVSCEAWCAANEEGDVPGPCVMHFDPEEEIGLRWQSREDTGCWEPGEVTHWRPRPKGLDASGVETCLGCMSESECRARGRCDYGDKLTPGVAPTPAPKPSAALERQRRLVATLPQTREQAAMLTPCLATGQGADPTPRLCGHCGKVAAPGGTCARGVPPSPETEPKGGA